MSSNAAVAMGVGLGRALASGVLAAWCLSAVAGDKQPIPPLAAREAARQVVLEVYAKELAGAQKQAAQAAALARTLLTTAAQTNDDPAARFALINEARTLAVTAANLELASAALDALEADFDIPPGVRAKVRVQTLAELARSVPGAEASGAAQEALALVDAAASANDFDSAQRAGEAALELARKAKDVALIRAVQARQGLVKQQQQEWTAAKAAEEKLAAGGEDPAAALMAGKYRCFTQGDWATGLPLLARSADKALQDLAQAELAAPADAAARVAVADGWWDQADKLPAAQAPHAARIRQHAADWYAQALPELTGLAKAKAETRIAAAAPQAAAGSGQILAFRFERGDFVTRGGRTLVRDKSGSGHDGEVIACAPVPGVSGGGLRFDGNKSVVQVPPGDWQKWEQATVCVWAWFDELKGGEVLFSNLDNLRLNNDVFHFMRVQFKSGGRFRGLTEDGGEAYKPQAKRWTHFAAVWDGQKCRLFADGKLVSESNALSDKPAAPTGPFTLGQNTGSFTANFKGVLDELVVYNRALDEREIAAIYNAAAKGAGGANP